MQLKLELHGARNMYNWKAGGVGKLFVGLYYSSFHSSIIPIYLLYIPNIDEVVLLLRLGSWQISMCPGSSPAKGRQKGLPGLSWVLGCQVGYIEII